MTTQARSDDEEEPERAMDRGILPGRLLVCCIKEIRASNRDTWIGDQIQCRTCLSYMEVNTGGNWRWIRVPGGRR